MTKAQSVVSENSEKKAYAEPSVKRWGTVADLTKTGLTNEGDDGKVGSVASQGR